MSIVVDRFFVALHSLTGAESGLEYGEPDLMN